MLLIGTTVSIMTAVRGGAQGLLLGVITLVLTGIVSFFVSRFYMGKGKFSPNAIANGTTAGTSVSIPAFMAASAGFSDELVATATAQIAGSMLITAIIAPILVALFFKWEQKRREKNEIAQIVTIVREPVLHPVPSVPALTNDYEEEQ